MTYHIETKNHYLRYALRALLPPTRFKQDTCVIDLSSYSSLLAILQCVRQHQDVVRFIFIGDSGGLSRALQPLIALESKLPLRSYCEKLCHCPGVSYDTAMDLLLAHRSLEGYSHLDKITVYSLLMRDSVHEAARFLGISNKKFYPRIDRLTRKLNQQNGLQTHQFLRREFHPEYVRASIDDPLCAALRQYLRTLALPLLHEEHARATTV